MADYDYRAGKNRVKDILNGKVEVLTEDRLPSDSEFTFDNAYYSWVTGIFIDIRESTKIFINENKVSVAKVVRAFTSEVIEILRKNSNLREIGIRGDCVYGIYTTAFKRDVYEIVDEAIYVNTFMKMLNKLLEQHKYSNIQVGIGISSSQELVVKAGRKDVGINSKVWIGKAVTMASNFSSIANKNDVKVIVLSPCTYENIIEQLVERYGEIAKTWFTEKMDINLGPYYDASLITSEFDKWINDGMKE